MLHMVNHIQITMKFIYRAAIKIIFVFINLLNLVGFEEQPLHLQRQQCGDPGGGEDGGDPLFDAAHLQVAGCTGRG